MRRVDHVAERVAVLADVDDEGVDVADLVPMPEREQRQVGAAPQAVVATLRTTRPSAPCSCGRAGAAAVGDLDEHGDSVAFCDRLAQPSCARHGS